MHYRSLIAQRLNLAVFIASLVALGCCAATSQAETKSQPNEVTLRVGPAEEDAYKLGRWCPVRIEFSNFSSDLHGRLELIAPDDEGRPVAYPLPGTFDLPQGERRTVALEVLIGRPAAQLQVRVVNDNGQVTFNSRHALSADAAATPEEFVALAVGAELGLAEAASSRQGDVPIRAIHATGPSSLPTSWWGYEGVDMVVLSTSDIGLWDRLDEARLSALTEWVGQGGRLMVSVGARGETILGEGGRLAELSPVAYLGQTQVREVVELEGFSGSHAPLENFDEQGVIQPIEIALVEPGTSQVLVSQSLETSETLPEPRQETPLVLRGSYGLGEVTLVLCDLDQAPLADWPALPVLMSRLCFEQLREGQSIESSQSRRVAHLGYQDIEGQLREALEQFPGVAFIPFWVVALLALGYIALIGPADYFLLRRFGRRMSATWITFPLLAAGLAGVIVFVGGAMKSRQPAMNQVAVIDIDTVDGYVRGNEWAFFYSPGNHRYDFAASLTSPEEAANAATEMRLGWQGRSGTGFGGMSATGPLATSAGRGYRINAEGSSAEIEQIPLPASSTRALSARWAGRYQPAAARELRASPEGFVQGNLQNTLNFELRDAWLYHAQWAYSLGDLSPGTLRVIDSTTPAINLNWQLTRRTIRDLQDVTTPWDPTSNDIPRVLEVMLFYNAAGGKTYTRLSAETTRQLDMSQLLGYQQSGSDRAVLWGRVLEPAVEIGVDGNESEVNRQAWTIYRLVLPITLPQSEPATP